MNDSTLSANTIIVRVSSWTSEKMGIKKDVEKADGKITGHYNHDTHYAFTDDKNKQYVKKMFEANNQLQSGIISISISVLSIFKYNDDLGKIMVQ